YAWPVPRSCLRRVWKVFPNRCRRCGSPHRGNANEGSRHWADSTRIPEPGGWWLAGIGRTPPTRTTKILQAIGRDSSWGPPGQMIRKEAAKGSFFTSAHVWSTRVRSGWSPGAEDYRFRRRQGTEPPGASSRPQTLWRSSDGLSSFLESRVPSPEQTILFFARFSSDVMDIGPGMYGWAFIRH